MLRLMKNYFEMEYKIRKVEFICFGIFYLLLEFMQFGKAIYFIIDHPKEE
jgi:hypothetical protein